MLWKWLGSVLSDLALNGWLSTGRGFLGAGYLCPHKRDGPPPPCASQVPSSPLLLLICAVAAGLQRDSSCLVSLGVFLPPPSRIWGHVPLPSPF